MRATTHPLKKRERDDYQMMLDTISEMVLEAIKRRRFDVVRRWAASLAHVGNVLLDDQAAKGPKAA